MTENDKKKIANSESFINETFTKLPNFLVNNSEYAGNMVGRYREREVAPKEYFGDGVKMPFEDIEVMVPSKYHELQTLIYGNYMQIPPVEKQETHSVKIIKLRTL